ncbi:MAG: hypothetical protein EBX35_07770 [Planctomycetia bacterium]|nr:hypothetical protein [Planctomycetia bacterium]
MAHRTSVEKMLRERLRLEREIAATEARYGKPSAVQLSRLRWYDERLADAGRSSKPRLKAVLRSLWSRLQRRELPVAG